jgi:preprotein translocase subunit YajC
MTFSTQSFAALFQADGGGISSILGSPLILIVAMVAIFYFLVILPQKRQRQQLKDLIENLKMNDEVVTNGGVIGKIKEIKENSFIIHSADKSFIEIGKQSVVGKKADV